MIQFAIVFGFVCLSLSLALNLWRLLRGPSVGDRIIIIHWAHLDEVEYEAHFPRVLVMNEDNSVQEALTYDPHPVGSA